MLIGLAWVCPVSCFVEKEKEKGYHIMLILTESLEDTSLAPRAVVRNTPREVHGTRATDAWCTGKRCAENVYVCTWKWSWGLAVK